MVVLLEELVELDELDELDELEAELDDELEEDSLSTLSVPVTLPFTTPLAPVCVAFEPLMGASNLPP